MVFQSLTLLLGLIVLTDAKSEFLTGKFPNDFMWGITSSVEYIEDGKYMYTTSNIVLCHMQNPLFKLVFYTIIKF